MGILDGLPRLEYPMCAFHEETVEAIVPRPRGHYRRPVVIDGANVIMGTSKNKSRITISGLLALVRIFVMHNFEVYVVVQRKFFEPYVTKRGWDILQKLKEMKVVIKPPSMVNDDEACLNLASQIAGVVVSNDQFRDLQQLGRPYEKFIHKYTSTLEFGERSNIDHVMTADGHYLAHQFFRIGHREGLFYCRPDRDLHTSLCKERHILRKVNWKQNKAKLMEVIDRAIIQVMTVEKKNLYTTKKFPPNYTKPDWLETKRSDVFEQYKHIRKPYVDAHGKVYPLDPLNLMPIYESQLEMRKVARQMKKMRTKDAAPAGPSKAQDEDGYGSNASTLSDYISSVPPTMLMPNTGKTDYPYNDDFECWLEKKDSGGIPLTYYRQPA